MEKRRPSDCTARRVERRVAAAAARQSGMAAVVVQRSGWSRRSAGPKDRSQEEGLGRGLKSDRNRSMGIDPMPVEPPRVFKD